MPENTDISVIRLDNVRLSFPHLFTANAMQEGQEKKFSATFLMDTEKHKDLIGKIEKTIERLALDKWKKKISFKQCLRDGEEKEGTDGYGEGVRFLSASKKTRPNVVDRNMDPLIEEDGKIYAGCYVNASIRLWVQDNQYGKRVNAELRTVQFVKDGESFGVAPCKPTDDFGPLGQDDIDSF